MATEIKQESIKKIDALKDTFTYKVSVKDFIYDEKSKIQMNAYKKAFNKFEIGTEATLRNTNDLGDTFIIASNDKTIAYYETFTRKGSMLCYVLFKSRKDTILFEQELKRIRQME